MQAEDQSPVITNRLSILWTYWRLLALASGLILLCAWLLWRYGQQMWLIVQDREALQELVQQLGWFGPLALVGFNAAQIVVAPFPGYVVQAVAGFLFGALWGGIWGTIGLLIGSMLAMWLARTFGLPLVNRLFGEARLARWERVTHSTSTLLWIILLLGPTGDLPYYLAGLSHVRFAKIFMITLFVRVPSVFFTAAAGAGVMYLNWWQIGGIVMALVGVTFLLLRYQTQLTNWFDQNIQKRLD